MYVGCAGRGSAPTDHYPSSTTWNPLSSKSLTTLYRHSRTFLYSYPCGLQPHLNNVSVWKSLHRLESNVCDDAVSLKCGMDSGWLYFLDKNYFVEESDYLNSKLPAKISS